MRVQDLTAELLSEIADELDFIVSQYESGKITFVLDENSSYYDQDNVKLKIVSYDDDKVFLWSKLGVEEINLHDPESIEKIKDWFEDPERYYDEMDTIPGSTWITMPSMPSGSYTITSSPNTIPITVGGSVTSNPISNGAVHITSTTDYLNLNNSLTSNHLFIDPGDFAISDDASIFLNSFGSLSDVQL